MIGQTWRRIAFGVIGWSLLVLIGSTLVWTVISRAGEEVSTSGDFSQGPLVAGPAQTSTPDSGKRGNDEQGSPETPAVQPRRTWTGDAGSMTAECARNSISLIRAIPSPNGYRAEVKENGPGLIEVEFEDREGDSGLEIYVQARCVEGSPRFTVSQED